MTPFSISSNPHLFRLRYVDHHKNNNRNIRNESIIIDVDTHIHSHIYTRQWIWANVSLFTHSITIFFCHRWFSSSSPDPLLSSLFFHFFCCVSFQWEKNYYFFMFVKKIIIFSSFRYQKTMEMDHVAFEVECYEINLINHEWNNWYFIYVFIFPFLLLIHSLYAC